VGTVATLNANDLAVRAFARRLQADGTEHVLLFGSHATGPAAEDSDYDLLIVSPKFEGVPNLRRHVGMHDLFYEVGGNAPLDLICLTPDEFEIAKGRITLVAAVLPEAIDLLTEAIAPG